MSTEFISYLQGCLSNYNSLNEAQIRLKLDPTVNCIDLLIITESLQTTPYEIAPMYCFLIK